MPADSQTRRNYKQKLLHADTSKRTCVIYLQIRNQIKNILGEPFLNTEFRPLSRTVTIRCEYANKNIKAFFVHYPRSTYCVINYDIFSCPTRLATKIIIRLFNYCKAQNVNNFTLSPSGNYARKVLLTV